MPQIPARMCRHGHGEVRKTYPSDFIAIRIDSGDEGRIRFTLNSRERKGSSQRRFRTIVQAERVQRLRGKVHAWQLGKSCRKCMGEYCSPIGEARMATRWRWFSCGDPAVQIGQGSAQQRRVVHRVKGELPAYPIGGAYGNRWKHTNAVLCTGEMVAPH